MAKKKNKPKIVSMAKYNKLMRDFLDVLLFNESLIGFIKEADIKVKDDYIETYNYNLNKNMDEMHTIVNKAVASSPQHIKMVETGTSSIMSLPDEIMQSQRAKDASDKSLNTSSTP